MAGIFGLDFGTTNSVISFVQRKGATEEYHPVVLDDHGRPHPSVVWYNGAETIVGRDAKDHMGNLALGVVDNFVRSPKMFLGNPVGIAVGGVNRTAQEVVAEILSYLRKDAESKAGTDFAFDRAVMTIPVTMEGPARAELRRAALASGIQIYQFVHEPLAALYGYLRQQIDFQQQCARLEGRLVLVFDWGGGTLDLTLCRIHHGGLVQVFNVGDSEVGGDKFDWELVRMVKQKHVEKHPNADWSRSQPTAEARLISQCEDAKIKLSSADRAILFIKQVIAGDGPEVDLDLVITRKDLEAVAIDLIRRGLNAIDRLLDAARVPRTAIEFCLATGGMVAMPAIREGLIQYFDAARVRTVSNSATIISEGAAWIAHDEVRVRLAKPIEVLHADEVYFPIIPSGTKLPVDGEQIAREPLLFYCVDPRDGFAKFTITRNRWPGHDAPTDPRVPYGCLTVEVDPTAEPLTERLELTVAIDHNCIVRATAQSIGRGSSASLDINNLEFGIELPRVKSVGGDGNGRGESPFGRNSGPSESGAIRVRSNIVDTPHARDLIPGEIATAPFTPRQHAERMYYVPCMQCGKNAHQIERFGCDSCAERRQAISTFEAERRWQDRMTRYHAERSIGSQRPVAG